jgi:hypothetical protein
MMWMDKKVDEMTREEAVEALKICMRLLRETQKSQAKTHVLYREIITRRRVPAGEDRAANSNLLNIIVILIIGVPCVTVLLTFLIWLLPK